MASITVETRKGIRGDEQLYLFWTQETIEAEAIDVGEPAIPGRRRKRAHDLMIVRLCEVNFTETGKDLHRQQNTEANDTVSSPASWTGSTNLDIQFFVPKNRC